MANSAKQIERASQNIQESLGILDAIQTIPESLLSDTVTDRAGRFAQKCAEAAGFLTDGFSDGAVAANAAGIRFGKTAVSKAKKIKSYAKQVALKNAAKAAKREKVKASEWLATNWPGASSF